jgi:hypothetical protein
MMATITTTKRTPTRRTKKRRETTGLPCGSPAYTSVCFACTTVRQKTTCMYIPVVLNNEMEVNKCCATRETSKLLTSHRINSKVN